VAELDEEDVTELLEDVTELLEDVTELLEEEVAGTIMEYTPAPAR
jgi:hypothetical protein